MAGRALGAYRALKAACEDAGYEHGAIMFHGYELETYYNAVLSKKWRSSDCLEALMSKFHKWFTNYGRDLMQPLYILAGIFALCGIVYCCLGTFSQNNFTHSHQIPEIAAMLSLRNTLGPLALAFPSTIKEISLTGFWLQTLSFLQIILSSGIWFVLILMVRRRFKL